MLKAMANLIRPATERRVRSPPPLATTTTAAAAAAAAADAITTDAVQDSLPVPTRPTLRSAVHDSVVAPSSSALSSRKRPASALADDATENARPPVKITVAQPHGELLRTTNGVSKALGIAADDLPSGASTPSASASASASLSVPPSQQTAQTPGSANADKRSLRSQDGGSRLKSDLAIYFSAYDDIIAGVDKSPDLVNIDAPIYLIDEPIKSSKPPQGPPAPEALHKSSSPTRTRKARAQTPSSIRKPSNASISLPAQSSTSFQEIDYSTITNIVKTDTNDDPLADSVYFTQHRRAERKEKQLRNIEKERAMHEKVQLERLLDGLQGPDWLKVMGITGVTDGERKEWEPKRDYFIREVEILVDKFRLWKEQEKRLRADKEAAQAKEESEDEEDETSPEPEPRKPHSKNHHVPAKQPLLAPSSPKPRRPPRPHGFFLPVAAPEPTTPFQSFYSKPHLRAAALGKQRHGRNTSAFGQPIPEWETQDFELPQDFVTPEFLRDNARKRRRWKREVGVGGAVGKSSPSAAK